MESQLESIQRSRSFRSDLNSTYTIENDSEIQMLPVSFSNLLSKLNIDKPETDKSTSKLARFGGDYSPCDVEMPLLIKPAEKENTDIAYESLKREGNNVAVRKDEKQAGKKSTSQLSSRQSRNLNMPLARNVPQSQSQSAGMYQKQLKEKSSNQDSTSNLSARNSTNTKKSVDSKRNSIVNRAKKEIASLKARDSNQVLVQKSEERKRSER